MSIESVVRYKAAISKRLEEKTSWGRNVIAGILEEELLALVEEQTLPTLPVEEFRISLQNEGVTALSIGLILSSYELAMGINNKGKL